MIRVWIPAPLRDVCGGSANLEVEGATLREVLQAVDARCPGLYERVVENNAIRPDLAIALNGEVSSVPLHERLDPGAEIAIVPALGGGR